MLEDSMKRIDQLTFTRFIAIIVVFFIVEWAYIHTSFKGIPTLRATFAVAGILLAGYSRGSFEKYPRSVIALD